MVLHLTDISLRKLAPLFSLYFWAAYSKGPGPGSAESGHGDTESDQRDLISPVETSCSTELHTAQSDETKSYCGAGQLCEPHHNRLL